MSYLEGDLRKYIQTKIAKNEMFEEKEVINILEKIAMALSFMHEKKIIHKDLKPENVFLCGSENIKIGDFGLSCTLVGSYVPTKSGTQAYLAPEMVKNSKYSAKSDVWSMGCIAYEICMLKHPFFNEAMMQMLDSICSAKFAPISTKYSSALRAIITGMLQSDEHKRLSSADVVEKLSDL